MEIPSLCDTRWVCRHSAVHLFKVRYRYLIEALEEIIDNSRNRCEAAEAIGLFSQMKQFSFLILLQTFQNLLGVTKPLSDVLQGKELDLSNAMHMVNALLKTLLERRSDDYFEDNIWNPVLNDSDGREIPVSVPGGHKRRTHIPRRLQDTVVMSTTGVRIYETSGSTTIIYRCIYYKVTDDFLTELKRRFDDSRDNILAISSCSPQSKNFFDHDVLQPLAVECGIEMVRLSPQLDIVRNMIEAK